MLYRGQDARVRTDLTLPSPGWQRTLTLAAAEERSVIRGEETVWSGRLAIDQAHTLRFSQTVREHDGRVMIHIDYTSDHDLAAEGLLFRIDLPCVDFKGGAASTRWHSVTLPEKAPSNPNLMSGDTASLEVRSVSGDVRWSAKFDRRYTVNLQDKSNESPRSYTFWVYVHRGSIAAGTSGSFGVDLSIDGVPDARSASLSVDTSQPRYRFHGFGGNYCFQIESPVTDYTLENLDSHWARTEISMADWDPQATNDQPNTRLRHEFELMRRLQGKCIPFIASIWRLPEWLLADRDVKGPDDHSRRIDPQRYRDLLDMIGSYLVYARDHYAVEPDLFSFNEPDLGIRVLFSAEEHRDLIKSLGAHLQGLGLKTKMLLCDVSNPRGTHVYAQPTVEDAEAMRYVGAVSFHSWGGASPGQYEAWASLAESLTVPLLVAEMGTDPDGWRGRGYDSYWYGTEELRMYQELLLYARPQATVYWEFTEDYSLVHSTSDGILPTGRYWLVKQLTDLTPAQSDALATASDHEKVLITAFRKDEAYAVHIANLSAAREARITGLPAGMTSWRVSVTTEERGFVEVDPVLAEDGGVRLLLPARSLVTLFSTRPRDPLI